MQNTISDLSDEAVLSMILAQQADWRELLETLLKRHHRALLTRCYVYLRNRQDAEDASQETQLRVFRAIGQFRGEAGFKTWLFAIADRQCHDIARKRTRHMLSEQVTSLIEIHEESLSAGADSSEHRGLVDKLLARLPRRERDILMLRFYVDLPFQGIADYLGLGLSATKMRLYRALDLFGVMLKAERNA
jgi:RNA polymerase sigma-70 factor (ECF subfamily)